MACKTQREGNIPSPGLAILNLFNQVRVGAVTPRVAPGIFPVQGSRTDLPVSRLTSSQLRAGLLIDLRQADTLPRPAHTELPPGPGVAPGSRLWLQITGIVGDLVDQEVSQDVVDGLHGVLQEVPGS